MVNLNTGMHPKAGALGRGKIFEFFHSLWSFGTREEFILKEEK